MPRIVSDVDTLQQYIQGVIGNAEHHARGVDQIGLAIIGAVLWRKDDDRELEVHERQSRMTNVLWAWIGGNRYAFSYNRDLPAIEIRRGTTQGAPVAAFNNETPVAEIKEFFARL